MIRTTSYNIAIALFIALMVLLAYGVIMTETSFSGIALLGIVLLEGVALDMLCSRFGILGKKSHLPLILFSVLSVLAVPYLSYSHVVYGGIWLAAFFLAFRSGEFPSRSKYYVIYFGVILGVAQIVNSSSVLLLLPVFLLFIQTGVRSVRDFLLGLAYFVMVIVAYVGLLYVTELESSITGLIPDFTLNYDAFSSIVVIVVSPLVLFLLLMHWLQIGSYDFRYPNQSKILNLTMLIQWVVASVIIAITSDTSFLLYMVMPLVVLLSFAMVYNPGKTFMNTAFFALIVLSIVSLWLYKIIFF